MNCYECGMGATTMLAMKVYTYGHGLPPKTGFQWMALLHLVNDSVCII